MSDQAEKCFITIAICTRDRAEALSRAVASILPQLDSHAELLIVDNASGDSTPKVAKALARKYPVIRLLSEPKAGVAHARNTAVAEACGKYVVFFDDDEVAEPGWFSAYREFFGRGSSDRLGSVGGPYVGEYQSPPPPWMPPDYGSFNLGNKQCQLPGPTGPAGGNCAYLKEAVLKVGGFDPALIRHEDSEMNSRLRDAGYEVWWLPGARVRHLIPASRCCARAQMRLWFSEGQSAALVRRRSGKSALDRYRFTVSRILVLPLQSFFQVTAALFFLLLLNRERSIRMVFRACRSIGMLTQILKLTWQPSSTRDKSF